MQRPWPSSRGRISSREATVKSLRTLRGLGLITTGRREVTILDLRGLRQAAGGQAVGG